MLEFELSQFLFIWMAGFMVIIFCGLLFAFWFRNSAVAVQYIICGTFALYIIWISVGLKVLNLWPPPVWPFTLIQFHHLIPL